MTDDTYEDEELFDEPDDFDDEFDEYDDAFDEGDDGHDEVVYRVGREGARRWVVLALGLVAVLVLVLGAVGFTVQRKIDPSGGPGKVVTVEVPEATSTTAIGELLADEGIITSAFVWRWYIKFHDAGPFEAGRYDMRLDSSMSEAIDTLGRGPKPPESQTVTIPEAFTVTEVTARLAEKLPGFSVGQLRQLLADHKITSRTRPADQPSYEGLLFPETYQVDKKETAQSVLQRMATQLDKTLDGLGADQAAQKLGLTRYQLVIVASLIEEEAKATGDQPKIARVIYNRLAQGIPLGIDATSRYEAVLAGRDRNDVDFDSKSPYNSRRIAGLPPTPIAAPGRKAIEAALHPADGPWIYYVLQDAAGHHFFTDSDSEFVRAKQECKDKGLGCG